MLLYVDVVCVFVLKMCPTVRGTMGAQMYPWSFADRKQLCIQWHRPALSPTQEDTDTVQYTTHTDTHQP